MTRSPTKQYTSSDHIMHSEQPHLATLQPDPDSQPMTTQTVLVVDDDQDIRELISATLHDEGFHVVTESDGAIAATAARRNPPGLILLDLMMPNTSGWDVMRMLRSWSSTSTVPVVLVSASRDLELACIELDAQRTLAKPFDLELLIATVRDYVSPMIS